MTATARMVAAVTLLGATLLAGAAPAHAAPDHSAAASPSRSGIAPAAGMSLLDTLPAETRQRMTAQIPLVDAASTLRTAVEAGQPRGFAGIGLVNDHVTLWWKGTLPADVATAVTAARRTAPVEVVAAPYSRVELRAAAARVGVVVRADQNDAAHAVRILADGTGLEVAVDGTPSARVPRLPSTGVKTTVVRQERLAPRSRLNDPAPYDGGAFISHGGVYCTSGFGVRDAASGQNYVLSAGHCGDIGQVWNNGADVPIGPITHKNSDHDTMLISTSVAGDHIYVGGQNDEVRARVIGWTEVFPGQLLCQSGVTSAGVLGGPICDLRVDYHYDDREDLVEATQLDGEESARGGDSGGPVYAVNADGTVLAAGTTTRSAGPGFGFQDFATARDDFGDIVPVTSVATTCRVSYVVTESWGTGFAASVTVHNSGPAISGWSLGWTFPGGQVVQGHWHGQFQQTGSSVVVTNQANNVSIPAGGSVNLGFTASGSAVNPAPFTLNGTTCS